MDPWLDSLRTSIRAWSQQEHLQQQHVRAQSASIPAAASRFRHPTPLLRHHHRRPEPLTRIHKVLRITFYRRRASIGVVMLLFVFVFYLAAPLVTRSLARVMVRTSRGMCDHFPCNDFRITVAAPDRVCGEDADQPNLVLALVRSPPGNTNTRVAIRNTWGQPLRYRGHDTRTFFLLATGEDLDPGIRDEISREALLYQDMMVVEQESSSVVTMAALGWLAANCSEQIQNVLLAEDSDFVLSWNLMDSLLLSKPDRGRSKRRISYGSQLIQDKAQEAFLKPDLELPQDGFLEPDLKLPQDGFLETDLELPQDGFLESDSALPQEASAEVGAILREPPAQESMGQEDMAPEAMPQEAMPQEAMPQEAMPLAAMPLAAMPLEAMPLEAMPQEAMPHEAMAQEAMPLEAMPQEAIPQEAMPQEAMPQEAMAPEAMPLEAMPQEAMPKEAMPQEAMAQEDMPQEEVSEYRASIVKRDVSGLDSVPDSSAPSEQGATPPRVNATSESSSESASERRLAYRPEVDLVAGDCDCEEELSTGCDGTFLLSMSVVHKVLAVADFLTFDPRDDVFILQRCREALHIPCTPLPGLTDRASLDLSSNGSLCDIIQTAGVVRQVSPQEMSVLWGQAEAESVWDACDGTGWSLPLPTAYIVFLIALIPCGLLCCSRHGGDYFYPKSSRRL